MLNDRGVPSMLAFAGLLLSGSLVGLDAQRTGVLSTATKDTSGEAMQLSGDALRARIERRANRAVLLFDPGLASAMRSSAHGFNVVFDDKLQEGRIQLNLCDLKPFKCTKDSFLLMLAGPLDEGATDLLNYDGFVGDTRLELAWTDNIVHSLKPTVTISGVMAYPKFSFRSASTLGEVKDRRVRYRFQPGVGSRGTASHYEWSFLASYAYERNFDEQDVQTVCTPASFGPSGTTVCSDIRVGEPTEVRTSIARLEVKIATAGAYAIGAAWKHDFTDGTNALDIPVYFLTATTGGLAGGCRVGFHTGKRASLTLFVNVFQL